MLLCTYRFTLKPASGGPAPCRGKAAAGLPAGCFLVLFCRKLEAQKKPVSRIEKSELTARSMQRSCHNLLLHFMIVAQSP